MNSQEILLALQAGQINHEDAKKQLIKMKEVLAVDSLKTCGTLMLNPYWKEEPITQAVIAPDYAQQMIMLCELGKATRKKIETCMKGVRCLLLQSTHKGIEDRFQTYAIQVFEEIQKILKDKTIGKMLIQIVVSTEDDKQLFSGLSGLLKTAQLENPKLIGQLIEVEPGKGAEEIVQILTENRRSSIDHQIRYQDGKRYIIDWSEIEKSQEEAMIPWKDQGVYLITGGIGGLGLIFAKEIAHKVKDATMILTGRSPLAADKQAQIAELESLGARIEYKQVDVTQKQAVVDLIQNIQDNFGSLHGIIHSAGMIKDNLIIKKTKEELQAVMEPKVTGLVNLDEASKDLSLDFFVLFSSITGALGNPGQADYATANAFMDMYARYRNSLVVSKQRHGQTLSMNWPLWQEGGMHVDQETEKMMKQNMGMIAMRTPTGIQALYRGLTTGKTQVMVIEGDPVRMKQKLILLTAPTTLQIQKNNERSAFTTGMDTGSLLARVETDLMLAISKLLKVKLENIDADTELNEYGFDSITFTQLANKINELYELELTPTIFFEYSTLHSIAAYLIAEHQAVFAAQFTTQTQTQTRPEFSVQAMAEEEESPLVSKRRFRLAKTVALAALKPDSTVAESIAIVGISGTFPMARNVNEFWQNLVEGKDCIAEIPKDRWDWEEFYGNPSTEANKTNIKWGGFIDGVAEFDPLFFGISPREAQFMDPQQRLLMTYVWQTIEDAGYAAHSFSGTNTGIFVGTMNSGYSGLISQAKIAIEGYTSTGMVASVGPNRMSYFLNIHGPSEPIETACSSSLVAIHRAVSAIKNGSCEMAIAGGVNTIVTPEFHISFSKAGMLSEDGRCKSFSDKADGYVRGEGAGMFLLKKLKDAERDGDHIYGVIRSTVENHGGRANSLTAPNPKAQAELLQTAYSKAGIDPRTVTYIEAHGTGTELGDPIEINGLKTAFKELYQLTGDSEVKNSHCGLGSVKTNVGHLELAAGAAGVIKVLLQMKYKTLVKNLHCETINPYIDLKDSPFYIVQEKQEWKALRDAQSNELPRRAGVSSFGFGGSNAHIVIEEYIPQNQGRLQVEVTSHNPVIIVLSAKNEERLKEQASQMLAYIREQQSTECNLREIAYTLQMGREAMEERLGFMASSIQEFEEKLQEFIEGRNTLDFYRGQVKKNKDALAVFTADEELQEAVTKWIQRRKYAKVLDLWVKGLIIDWKKLYGDDKPRRVSLPTYPFTKESYWIPANHGTFKVENTKNEVSAVTTVLHPLLHHNTSDLSEQRFTSTFTGQEFFLVDHQVQGESILPEMAYLEIARAAVEQATGALQKENTQITLKNNVWTNPIIVGDKSVRVHIGLYPEEAGQIAYEIYSQPEEASAELITHSQGIAVLNATQDALILDISALKAECSQTAFNVSQLYETFKAIGLDYGPAHRGIEQLYIGQHQILVRLILPPSVSNTQEQFILHPSLMDAAFQASMSLTMKLTSSNNKFSKPIIPFALEEIEVFGKCTSAMWAHIRPSVGSTPGDGLQKLDIDLCDDHGHICVRMKALNSQENKETLHNPIEIRPQINLVSQTQEPCQMMTFEEVWEEQTLPDPTSVEIKTVVCFLSDPEYQQAAIDAVQALDQQTEIIFISQSTSYQKYSEQKYSISSMDGNTYQKAFQSIQEENGNVDAILYLWPLEDKRHIQDTSCIVHILQAITSVKLNPRRFLLAAQYENALDRCYLESWIGFERSLGLVLPRTEVAAVLQEAKATQKPAMEDWLPRLMAELKTHKVKSALYQETKRRVCQIRPTTILSGESPLKSGATYLITGGCGGLGLLLAKHLAKTQGVNLVLTGRSPLNTEKQSKIKEIEDLGSQILYIQADICDLVRMKEGLSLAKERFKEIRGLIHAAGIESDQSILGKDLQDFQKVLDPKIKGTLVLDELLQEEPLDFVCYFSSSAAILGDFGSCDYAIGNRFLMAYAHYRKDQQRHGKAIVINWPLWQDGGMGYRDEESTEMYLKSSGQRALETEDGLAMFDRLLSQDRTQHLLLVGQPRRVHGFLGLTQDQPFAPSPIINSSLGRGRRPEMKGLSLEQCLEWDCKEHISKLLEIPRDRLDKEENLADFGLDSIMLAQFAITLTNYYRIEITPALFFGYSTIEKLTQYFLTQHREALEEFYREDVVVQATPQKNPAATVIPARVRFTTRNTVKIDHDLSVPEPIAIIGMSGRFPGARTIEEMWAILAEGQDMVKEIPQERFDWRQYYGDPSKEPGKTNCKWCGYISGASEFDPLFFEISPREAETMDPRQRLLLQESWKALEDAGYGTRQIKTNKIGMFVGVEQGDYQLIGSEKGGITSNHNGILASRLAYFLNLSGPVMALNTACSSGLVAAHQACLSLHNQECDTAIVAGINLLLTPTSYIMASQAGMLSENGKCFAFDKRANGMVPGEAAAVVVLKRLSQAEADKDPIYAVIQGSAVNYDGKTNGITAPSGVAQTSLLKAVYDQYKVNPEDIEYIVAHGTGTKLGDPVEVNALYDAFKGYTKKQGYCAITSPKTNFGHTFAASGLVSLVGLVQSLHHKTIPASLHCEQENDYIDWKKSPFYVNKVTRPWPEREGKDRIGAVSAFGMSGTNAHMVVRSYLTKGAESSPWRLPYYLLALSAKTKEALQEKIQDMITVLQKRDLQEKDLLQISYTLLEGRQHFNHRCAIVIQDCDDAIYVWNQAHGRESLPNLFRGKVLQDFKGQKGLQQYAQDLIEQSLSMQGDKNKYQDMLLVLADLYCQGYDLDWNKLYPEIKPQRISLPSYPFAKERYWVSETENSLAVNLPIAAASIHPLLHQNTSDLVEQRFTSTFTGQEFFLADHLVKGQSVLPGVAQLEMARAAMQQATSALQEEKTQIKLKNIVWAHPIAVGDKSVSVHIGLYPEEDQIAYEIYSQPDEAGDEPIIHSQGVGVLDSVHHADTLDISVLQAECSQIAPAAKQLYEVFKTMGLDYGTTYRGIEQVYMGQNQALARLTLAPAVIDTQDQFILHPSLMDAALQASIVLMMDTTLSSNASKPILPFALDELEVFGNCAPSMWAHIRPNVGNIPGDRLQKMDIDLCNDQGHICVRMKAFTFRILEGELNASGATATRGTMILQPYWREQTVAQEDLAPDYAQHLVILCELDNISSERITTQMNKVRCLTIQYSQSEIEERFQRYAVQVFDEIKGILKDKPKDQVLIQIVVSSLNEQQLCSGLSGLLKTAQLENPKLIGQLIKVEPEEETERIVEKLRENSRSPIDNYIRYQDKKRYVVGWSEVEASQETMKIPWKDQGVYLITGGVGALGLIFAKEIAHKVKDATLILTGRSPLNGDKQVQLLELESLGARIEYKQVDVTQKQSVSDLIQDIQEKFGSLHGIIHSAGVIKDNFILKKTKEEFQAVLAPKVAGLVHLDQASKDLNLDFFVLFSSTTGAFGNLGQVDYATANSFMDAYARYRNSLVVLKQRKGQTLSINWPLWKEGGMHVGAATEKMLRQSMGMTAMQTITGIYALYQSLHSGKDQIMVMEGDLKRLQDVFLGQPDSIEVVKQPFTIEENTAVPSIGQDMLWNKTENYFKKLLSFVFKLPANRIEASAPLEKYGIDSVMVIQLTNQLEKTFGSLSKTLFFEYQNIQELTGYFLEAYRDQLIQLLGMEEKVAATTETFKDSVATVEPIASISGICRRPRFVTLHSQALQERSEDLDIAIIGVSGRYPGARNVQEFWRNLQTGKDCITEIPKDRWDHSLYFDEDKNKPGKTYSKWGGFLDGVDQFDPLFFNISPREAEIMDPQERLFLQCVYETIEDAGYTRESLGFHKGFGLGGNVGVYVGVMYEEYQLYGAQAQSQGRPVALSGIPSSIANRVSYFCNFHGPSMAVDTMCSSSLTAIYLACQSLQRGGCELAIAGGVNISIHPNKYLMLGQGRFVSSKGWCESFGQGGDGYVPGEGVGAVLLKPLSKAVAAGDHIYGIIKAAAINHGGKTNGYTVPNPNAQASVIGRAFKDAGINPRAISYIEAHGTGTSLGDPIEIAGLMKTFQEYTQDKQFCAIGSAKSNIGHCESAAGIAGITKVLLQLKYRQLVPSLHSEVLNPNIEFSNTPFVVQQELMEWKRPLVEINGRTIEYPRIAGISSFGAGGSNAHVVIEEYIPKTSVRAQNKTILQDSAVIVLSAKSEAQLQEQAQRLLAAINEQQLSDKSLANIAFTLQVGREAMEERLGLIVGSIKELEEKLKRFIEGQDSALDLYQGQTQSNKEVLAIFAAYEEMTKIVENWMDKRDYGKVLDLWVKGLIVDWNKLYGDEKPLRISLPTYPFAKERYWVPEITEPMEANSLSLRNKIQFNDIFYHQIMDEIMNDTISIDAAVQKAKRHG
jgi:polyketide synthase PksN